MADQPNSGDDFVRRMRERMDKPAEVTPTPAPPLAKGANLAPAQPPAPQRLTPTLVYPRVVLPVKAGALHCPHCHEIDQVIKISTLFSESTQNVRLAGTTVGVSQTVFGVGGTSVNVGRATLGGASQSLQGQAIAPPPRPRFQSAWGPLAFAGILFGGVFAVLGFCSGGIGVSASNLAAGLTLGAALFLAGVVLFAMTILLATNATRKRNQVFEAATARWERHTIYWNSLFACRRCDLVFLPGAPGTPAPAAETRHYLGYLDQMGYGHVLT